MPRHTLAHTLNPHDYIWWDSTLNRWDIKFRALLEQTDPRVNLLIKLVVRSWFIPPKGGQLCLDAGE